MSENKLTPEFQQLVEHCAQIDEIDREIKSLQAKKKKIATTLLPSLKKLSDGKFTLANGAEIVACTGTERVATKAAILAEFKEKGAAFWASIEPKVREYLSVVRKKK